MKNWMGTVLVSALLLGSSLSWAVPAAPGVRTFTQPDGSTFRGQLRGDEFFNWVETQEARIAVKNRTSGYFEFAVIREESGRNRLAPSGIRVASPNPQGRQAASSLPAISREQLSRLRQQEVAARRQVKLPPVKRSP